MTTVTYEPKGLTPELIAELDAMPDDMIDMPEVTDRSGWTRGKFYRPIKQQVTLRLDADILDWFKTRQGGARLPDRDQRGAAEGGGGGDGGG